MRYHNNSIDINHFITDVIGEVVALGKMEFSERNEKQAKRIPLELKYIE